MNLTTLIPIVTLLVALSVASERLVEILKGFWPWLNAPQSTGDAQKDAANEGRRQATIHILSVIAGLFTAALTGNSVGWDHLGFEPHTPWWMQWLALGLLTSGGSGFWNSILAYLVNVKGIKSAEVERTKAATEQTKATAEQIKVAPPGTPLPGAAH